MAEFGSLEIPRIDRDGKPIEGCSTTILPTTESIDTNAAGQFTARTGIPIFPIGLLDDGTSHLGAASDARIYLLHTTGAHPVARSIDEAITWLVRRDGALAPVS
jgi:hypothetical protein